MADIVRYIKKLKPYNIQKGFRYLKHYGFKEFMVRLKERMEPEEVPYGPWFESHRASEKTLARQNAEKWPDPVTISVCVPVFRTPENFLREMIDSVLAQSYPYFELCLVNADPSDQNVKAVISEYSQKDKRIISADLTENLGIGENTNACIRLANGEYVALLDHDDLLEPDALFEVAKCIAETQAELIYTDEDKIDETGKEHYQPHFKPCFNIDLLRSNNYICHFLVIKKDLYEKAGGYREGYDGAQDHDLIFRCVEKAAGIERIPRILYHWRTHKASTADNPASKMYAYDAGKRAIEGNLERCGLEGEVSSLKDFGFYRVKYRVKGEPLVSIIIPNKDSSQMLETCISSIEKNSTYKNREIIVVENNSTEKETFEYYGKLEASGRAKVIRWPGAFNFSAINNFAVEKCSGEYIIFLNNDIEIVTQDWIEELLGNVQRPDVGAAGVRLVYPDGTIQHAGVIIGIGGIAGHAFLNMDKERTGYLHKASIQQDLSAVTAACMMVKRSVFESIGGFDEKLTVAFNDVDLCLRINKAGCLVVYDPFVEHIHYESKSRGAEDTEEKVRRFQSEIEYMRTRWIDLLKKGDPYYNPNLTLSKWNYSIKADQG